MFSNISLIRTTLHSQTLLGYVILLLLLLLFLFFIIAIAKLSSMMEAIYPERNHLKSGWETWSLHATCHSFTVLILCLTRLPFKVTATIHVQQERWWATFSSTYIYSGSLGKTKKTFISVSFSHWSYHWGMVLNSQLLVLSVNTAHCKSGPIFNSIISIIY